MDGFKREPSALEGWSPALPSHHSALSDRVPLVGTAATEALQPPIEVDLDLSKEETGSVWERRAGSLAGLLTGLEDGLSKKELAAKAARLAGFEHVQAAAWCMNTYVGGTLKRMTEAGLVAKDPGHRGKWRLTDTGRQHHGGRQEPS